MRVRLLLFLFLLGNQGAYSYEWKRCSNSSTYRVLLPTVPSSGNTYFRQLLEQIFQVPTGAVYSEVNTTWHAPEKAFFSSCGTVDWMNSSCNGRVSLKNPHDFVVVKLHHPFYPPAPKHDDCISALVTIVRHPIENYFAWRRHYKVELMIDHDDFVKEFPLITYMQSWHYFFKYWETFARAHRIPNILVKYEKLCSDPAEAASEVVKFLTRSSTVPMRYAAAVRQLTEFRSGRSKNISDCFNGWRRKVGSVMCKGAGVDTAVNKRVLRSFGYMNICEA